MLLDLFWRRHKSDPDADGTSNAELEQDDELGFPPTVKRRLDMGMPVDVLGPNAETLFNARVVSGNDIRLTLGRLPGTLSFRPITVGEPVVLKAYDSEQDHVYVRGVVLKSSVTEIVIKNWTIEATGTNRDGARLPLNAPGQLYIMTDKYRKHPKDCMLSDLSLSGARIPTSEELVVGDEYNLSFEVLKGDGRMTCHAQVVWAADRGDNLHEYGLLFAQMDGWRVHALKDSFDALRESIMRKTRA